MTDDLARRAGRDASATPFDCIALVAARRRGARRLPGRRLRGLGGSRLFIPTGSPAFRSARSIPRSSPAIRRRIGSQRCAASGKVTPLLGWADRRSADDFARGDDARRVLNQLSAPRRPSSTARPAFSRRVFRRPWMQPRGSARGDELLRYRGTRDDAGAPRRFRPHQCRRDALQRRRGQRAQRQFRLFRHRRRIGSGPSM